MAIVDFGTINPQGDYVPRDRVLTYDLAAIRDLEAALGGQPLGLIVGQLANLGINALVLALWAGLKHEDRTITPHLVTKRLETYLKAGRPLRKLADAINDGLEESGLFTLDTETEGNGQPDRPRTDPSGAR
jgi:hypothetical protein